MKIITSTLIDIIKIKLFKLVLMEWIFKFHTTWICIEPKI